MARSRSARRGVACERECVVEERERERERAREGACIVVYNGCESELCAVCVDLCFCEEKRVRVSA